MPYTILRLMLVSCYRYKNIGYNKKCYSFKMSLVYVVTHSS